MGDHIKVFLHRDDFFTVTNGKTGEVKKPGQIYRKRFLTDTVEDLTLTVFLSTGPSGF